MAVISFSKKTFEKEIGKLDEEMENKISMFGTPVEDIIDDEVQVEVFPNRPDMLSYQGFKRSFLAFLGKKTGMKKYKINKPEKNFEVEIDSSVKNVRPYTACAIIKGLKLSDEKIKEIIEIQEKLHATIGRKRKKVAIGIYPLEKIKLPIKFKAMEPDRIKFTPLESEKEMSGLEILQKNPTGKEYAHLLAGKVNFPVFMDAEEKILSMPPIINSEATGKVTEKTKSIFIECSGFDLEILKKCLNILTTTFAEMGGKIYQMRLKYSGGIGIKLNFSSETTPQLNPEKTNVSHNNIEKLLGIKLSEKEVKRYLERMGYNYQKGKVEIPPWRTDILHERDFIEDIAIAHGYENFKAEIPEISTTGKEDKKEIMKRKISQILSGLEMLEVSNYHLTTKREQFDKMGEIPEKKNIEIINSKTDYNILRKNLSHYLMKNLSENIDSEYPQKIFEVGKIFLNDINSVIEEEKLSLAITPGNYTELRQIIEYLFNMLDIKIKFEEAEIYPNYYISGRVARIMLDDKKIGLIGEVHPKTLKNWKIKMPVSISEISLEKILEEKAKE